VVALAGATVLTAALGACGGGDDEGGGSGGEGKTLTMLIGANTQYPEEFAAWQKSISDKFKAQTGATVKFETFATANDELTKIQTSVVSGTGPDVYAVGTTFTPTAYSTGAFVKLGDEQWQKVGGKDRFVPPRWASPVRTSRTRWASRGSAGRSSWRTTPSCSRRPASTSRRPPGTSWRSRPSR